MTTPKTCISSPAELLVSELTELIYGQTDHENSRYISMLHKDHQDSIPLFIRCLTTGSDDAKTSARVAVEEIIERLREAYADCEYPEDIWIYDGHKLWHPHSTIQVLSVWNVLNVLNEIGEEVEEETEVTEKGKDYLERVPSLVDSAFEDYFWRGVTALELSGVEPTRNNLEEYIEFAGNHADVSRVIEISRTRGMSNAKELRAILQQQDETTTALCEGAL